MVGIIDTSTSVLPPLREEIHCYRGPVQFDGAPSWTLHDPANNQFFRIGWVQFEILSRWSLADPQKIVDAINQETTIDIDQEEIERFYAFLFNHHLLCVTGEQAIKRLWQRIQNSRQSVLGQLVHNYLFFKIPLFKPDRLLAQLYPYIAWIYSFWFTVVVLLSAVLGGVLVSRQWEQFVNTFPYFFNWQGLSQYFIALLFAKLLHESGHAFTAHRYGCRVPTMGIAFMAMYPMLYTDASETWKLNVRGQRLAIASAGIIAELCLAAFATLAWSFMDDGVLRSCVFLLASSTWVMTLLVNLSPFMRFDGYYLLSDWLRIENLQPRAFAYARWQLREWLFALNQPAPEILPKKLAITLVVYAWCTWIYRLFLFLGIAWMVYHFFFKLLGIIMMMVEIGWFILRPVYGELKNWPQSFVNTSYRLRLLGLLASLALFMLIPWQQHIEVPALIKPAQYAEIYLPYSGRLDYWPLKPGQTVKEGENLAEISSSQLQYEQSKAVLEGESLSWRLAFQGMDENLVKRRQIQISQLNSSLSKQSGLAKQLQKLQIQTPMSGKVLDLNQTVNIGQWLKAGELLMAVGDDSQYTVEAFVNEHDIQRVTFDQTAMFYPENTELESVMCRVKQVDNGSTSNLPNILVSTFGGPIAVRTDKNKKNIAEQAQFRIQLTCDSVRKSPDIAPIIIRGVMKIKTSRSSLFSLIWDNSLALLWRESGF